MLSGSPSRRWCPAGWLTGVSGDVSLSAGLLMKNSFCAVQGNDAVCQDTPQPRSRITSGCRIWPWFSIAVCLFVVVVYGIFGWGESIWKPGLYYGLNGIFSTGVVYLRPAHSRYKSTTIIIIKKNNKKQCKSAILF